MSEQNIDTAAWFSILQQGFAAQSFPLGGSANITVFKKYLLRAGYVNFPFGIRSEDDHARIMDRDTLDSIRSMGVDLLRINWPERFGGYANLHSIRLPEASILELGAWSEERLESDVRYEIRRARREGITIRQARHEDAEFVSSAYQETVLRNQGTPRYTTAYFHALLKTSETQLGLLSYIALTPNEEPCGFVITAVRNGVSHYLHAGMRDSFRHLRSGYALMSAAITSARDIGCHEFSFMTSPANQPSLVKFKKKWGGTLYEINHFDIPLNIQGRLMNVALHLRR